MANAHFIGATDGPVLTTGEFLKTLWGDIPPGKVLIWTLPDKKSRWYAHFENVTADMRFHEKEDVYTGVGLAPHEGLRLPSNKRLKEWEVAGIAAFWSDIDVAHPVHKTAKQYPPSIEKALEALEQLPFAATIIVDSGHGVQLWWVLKEVWIFEDEADRERARRASQWWHRVIKGIFAEHGWDVDSTFDLPRVMRLPGTWNNKEPEDRRRVEVTGGCGERYDRQQFLDLVPEDFQATPMGARRNRSENGNGYTVGTSGLVLDPEAEPNFTRIQALLKLEPKFSKTWEMQRPDLPDQSASGYDMALANYAVRASWPDQEVANLLIAFRRRHGVELKLRENYYAVTIAKAHEPMKRQRAEEDLQDAQGDPQDAEENPQDPQDAEEDPPEDQSAHSGGPDEPGSQGASAPGGARAGDPEGPSPIMATLPKQGEIKVPRVIATLVRALTELAACNPRAALAALLGAISALASGDADLEWPNPGDVTPLTLFVLYLAESGSRKSSAWGRAFNGHRIADRRVIERWEEAKAEHREAVAASKGQKKGDSNDDLPIPLDSSPIILRRDATIEVLVRRLARGRREQCWETSEAGTLIGGFSFSRETRSKTLSDLQDLWSDGIVQLDRVKDDVEIMVHDARLTLAWSCQCKIGRDLILGESAANGFSARCLLSADDQLPEYRPKPGNWPDGWSAQRVIKEFSDWIVQVRGRQDYVHKGKEVHPERTTYRLSPEAWEAVDQAGALAHGAAAGGDLTQHEKSFLARVGENTARVAAVLAYHRRDPNDGDAVIGLDDVCDARDLVRSCYEELQRQGVWATATADAEAATWATKRLGALSDRYQGKREGTWRINHWLACEGAGPAKHLRGDPEARSRIIEMLESHGWINPAGRGVWTINPAPGDNSS